MPLTVSGLYQFLMYLSTISGISIIIDPYWVDEPRGGRERTPLDPIRSRPGGSQGSAPAASSIRNQCQRHGYRQLDNVPFDQALNMVLDTQPEKVVP
jgi:hypothetical protein